MTKQILESIDVDGPVNMEGVERIDQITDTKTRWVTKIAGVEREFDAETTEQHPDERVAWTTTNGTHQAGVVTFHRIGDSTTRVTLQLDHDPQGFVEKAGDVLGIIERPCQGRPQELQEVHRGQGRRGGRLAR